jgi:hypothetical protein
VTRRAGPGTGRRAPSRCGWDPDECADLLRLTPRDLLDLGLPDAVVGDPSEVVAWLAELIERPSARRREERHRRWSHPLPGVCDRIVM